MHNCTPHIIKIGWQSAHLVNHITTYTLPFQSYQTITRKYGNKTQYFNRHNGHCNHPCIL